VKFAIKTMTYLGKSVMSPRIGSPVFHVEFSTLSNYAGEDIREYPSFPVVRVVRKR
jgi:hypothetical protein